MSFGRPGFADTFKVSPPQRGSFPLDHDGECKEFMLSYIKCLKSNTNNNGQCRLESKKYLECRMDNGLMTRDDFQNLGLGDVNDNTSASIVQATTTTPAPTTTTPTATSGSASTPAPNTPQPVQAERI